MEEYKKLYDEVYELAKKAGKGSQTLRSIRRLYSDAEHNMKDPMSVKMLRGLKKAYTKQIKGAS